jgi:gliding motility-associated-like protein
LILFLPAYCLAQITSPLSSAIRYTSYPSEPGRKDQIFIFCNTSGSQKGSMTAQSPGGAGLWNYTWYKWVDATKDFTQFIKTELSVTNSVLTSLDEGGYKVRITNGATFDTSLVAWIHLDKPYADAKLQNFTCDYVALNGTAAIDTFFYRDPANGNPVKLRNAYAFLWSSTPPSAIPYPNIELDPVTFSPPLEDVVYKLQVTDSFKCVSESSFPYTSIHVKADFSVDPEKGEAPLPVSFTDKSIRATKYYWEFGDDSVSTLKDPPQHTYYRPGEYSVKLTIESDQLCVDSLRFEKIVVEPSELQIPNVFTPDGDGLNDYFIVESKSLKKISVDIFSRSGLKVYSFSGEGQQLADWTGWDGTVNNSSSKAAPGIYYYIIRALGWDDVVYDSKEFRGFLHLYR